MNLSKEDLVKFVKKQTKKLKLKDDQLEELTKERDQLVAQHLEASKNLADELGQLKQQRDDLQTKLDELAKGLGHTGNDTEDVPGLKQERDDLRTKVDEFSEQVESLKRERDDLAKKLEQGSRGNVGDLDKQLQEKDAVIAEKDAAHTHVLERMRELLSRYKSLQKKFALAKEESKKVNAMSEELESSQQARQETEAKVATLTRKLEESLQSRASLEEMLNQVMSENETLKQQNRAEPEGTENMELKQQLEDLRQNLDDNKKQNEAMQQEQTMRLEQELARSKGLEQELEDLRIAHEKERAQEMERVSELTLALEEQQRRSQELQTEIETLQQQSSLGSENDVQREELAQQQEQTMRLEQELENLATAHEKERAREMERVRELTLALEEQQSSSQALQAEIETLKQQSSIGDEDGAQIEDHKAQLEELNQRVEEKQELADDLRRENEDLSTQLQSREAEIQKLKEELGNAEAMETLKAEIQTLKAEKEEKASMENMSQMEIQALKEELENLKKQQNENEVDSSQEPETLKTELERMKEEAARLQNREAQLLEMLAAKEENLHDDQENLEREIEHLKNQCDELTQEIETLRQGSSRNEMECHSMKRNEAVCFAQEIVLESGFWTAAKLADDNARLQEKLKELIKRYAAAEKKGQEYQKKFNEVGKRFKVLRQRYQGQQDAEKLFRNKQLKTICTFSVVERERRLDLLHGFTHWKAVTASATNQEAGEKIRTEMHELKEEKETLQKQVEANEANIKKLKGLLNESRTVNTGLKKELEARSGPPPSFDPTKDIICTVDVEVEEKKELWVCIDSRSRGFVEHQADEVQQVAGQEHDEGTNMVGSDSHRVEWIQEGKLKEWMDEKNNSKWFRLPETIQTLIRKEEANKVKDAEGQAAWAMSQVETLKTDMANYKRRAQIALKKAQDEAKRSGDKKRESEQQLIQQLETELARVTRLVDSQQQKIETLQSEKAHVEIALTSAQRDVDSANEMYSKLEKSITERIETMKQNLLAEQEHLRHDEVTKHTSKLESMQEEIKSWEATCGDLRQENTNLEDTLRKLEHQKEQMEDRVMELEKQVAQCKTELSQQEKQAAAAATTTITSILNSKQLSPKRKGSSRLVEKEPRYEDLDDSHLRHREIDDGGTSGEEEEVDPVLAAATAALPSSANSESGDSTLRRFSTNDSVASNSALFVEQLDSLHSQHARDRISWQREMEQLKELLQDAQSEQRLLHEQNVVLKEQIRDMNRTQERTETLGGAEKNSQDNLLYLKNAVFKYMSAKEKTERSTLLPVVATILKFSPDEIQTIRTNLENESSGSTTSFFGW